MSGKRAKEKRKEDADVVEKLSKGEVPASFGRPIHEMSILMFENGTCQVRNIPGSLHNATVLLNSAMGVIMRQFAMLGKEGKLDDDFNIIQSDIVVPKRAPLIIPGG